MWNYYRDETDGADDNSSYSKSFEYETTIIEKTLAHSPRPPMSPPNPNQTQPARPQKPPIPPLNTKVTIPLKHLSAFLRYLNLYQ